MGFGLWVQITAQPPSAELLGWSLALPEPLRPHCEARGHPATRLMVVLMAVMVQPPAGWVLSGRGRS